MAYTVLVHADRFDLLYELTGAGQQFVVDNAQV